jgi:eukaryotic-like serine/threonine-protein kinase
MFLSKLQQKTGRTFALPTEAQWEYACRAGTITRYCFGDNDANLGDYAWFADNSQSVTHPVGEKKPNRWGLYDMHGNVWEWCADAYGPYPGNEVTPPQDPGLHVIRGGGWTAPPEGLRSSNRNSDWVSYKHVGLRCVMPVDELTAASSTLRFGSEK